MRCFLYARYSTELQTEASIGSQLGVCRDFARARDWTIAGEFEDQAISGGALGNRPGAQAALAACQRGDALVVNDATRLARSQDLAPLVARLKFRGVRVIGVQDAFDSETRIARMQAGLSGIMSEEFRQMIGDRTHAGQRRNALEGKATGGKAYGNAEIVREAFARFAAGESLKAIASDFNRRDIPSPGAAWKPRAGVRGRWLVSALHAMLHNELYVGRVVWNRSRWEKDPDSGKRIRRERPETEWIVRQVEPVVDEDTWRRVQARFRTNAGRGGVRRYLLSGLLECALCGSKMTIYGGGVQQRYICSQFHGGGVHACPNTVTIPKRPLEELVLGPIEEKLLSREAVAAAIAEMRLARVEAAKAAKAPPDDAELRTLERLVREGLLSTETAAPAIAEARRKAQATRAAASELDVPWPSESLWRATVAQMREVLRGPDVEAARDVLRRMVGPSIRCEPDVGGVHVEMTPRRVWMATGSGSGSWVGSGGPLRSYLPCYKRAP